MPIDPGVMVDSLGWALLHSIWQIGLVAALVWAALRITPRHQAQLRFLLAYGGLAATLLLFIGTWIISYRTIGAVEPLAMAYAPPAQGWDAVIATLGQTTGFISAFWALGFSWLGIRYLQALRATNRLRHEGTGPVPAEWETRFRLWVERLGADGRAAILQSSRITTPLTIGTLKPVVLVPAGFFLRMPIEQAEAVLVHEIAHICRQDYLLGLIQALICNIFFFHPAIAYLSRQIDIEREYACDARVVAETGNANALAQGLGKVALESHDMLPGFAMAADGSKTPLMNRIARLRERPFRREHGTTMPAALTLVLAGCLTVAATADTTFSSGEKDGEDAKDPAAAAEEPMAASEGEAVAEVEIVEESAREVHASRPDRARSDAAPKAHAPSEDRWASANTGSWAFEIAPNWADDFRDFRPEATKNLGGAFRRAAVGHDRNFLENAVIRAAIFETETEIAEDAHDEQCEDKAEMIAEQRSREAARRATRMERAEAQRDREIARMEAQAEREIAQVEREMARAEREIEREMTRVEREMARVEQQMEQSEHVRSASFQREMQQLTARMSVLGSELQSRLESHRERIQQRVQRAQRDRQRYRSVTPPAPPAPPEPPAPTITISFYIQGSDNETPRPAPVLRLAAATTGDPG
ncbi:M56 family metallopeptidase [Parasphingopyxis sp.]|uniref:M56 family metallopeptidase n=1 Tax=Parasphingopyxis sp. TaxID=1920299 RepID=UPI002602D588|nr:M56 family metallopeptidase [Parasphingopyxis sp.]